MIPDVNADIIYQLDIRRKELLALCRRWHPSLQVIPQARNEEFQASWGPSIEELLAGSDVELSAAETGKQDLPDSSDDEQADSESDDASGEEDLLEMIAFTEIYHDCSSTSDVDNI